MAVPFRKVSKTRKRLRRTHFKLTVTGLTTCTNCGALIQSHKVCPKCGFYKGKDVMTVAVEEKTKEKPKRSLRRKEKITKEAKAVPKKAAPAAKKVVTKQKTGE